MQTNDSNDALRTLAHPMVLARRYTQRVMIVSIEYGISGNVGIRPLAVE